MLQQNNNYNDRVIPINTREDNVKLNDFNYNSLNLTNQNSMANLNSINQQNNMNTFSPFNNQNNMNNLNSFNTPNNMNNLNSFNNQNNVNNFNSINNQNINNNEQATNITSLQMNNNLYSQDFKPIEKGGNFSFLSDNSQNVNITKSLDYSSLLSDVYS